MLFSTLPSSYQLSRQWVKSKKGSSRNLVQKSIRKYLAKQRHGSESQSQSQSLATSESQTQESQSQRVPNDAADFTHTSSDGRWVCGGKDLHSSAFYTPAFAKAVFKAWDGFASKKREDMACRNIKEFRPAADAYIKFFAEMGYSVD